MDFLLTKEKIYDKIFIENKKGEQKTMKKKWDMWEKKWNAVSIQKLARRNTQYLIYMDRKDLNTLINEFINKGGLHHRFTKAYLRAIKKLGKQERRTKNEIQRT